MCLVLPYADADLKSVRALSHPLRVGILAVLGDRTLTAAQLARELETDPRTVAYHARTLERLGYLAAGKDPRGGAVRYQLLAAVSVPDHVWAEAPTTAKRDTIAAALDQLQNAAAAALSEGGFDRGDIHLSRTIVELDQEAWRTLADEMRGWLERTEALGAEARERIAAGNSESLHATLGVMLFETASTERSAGHGAADVPEEAFSESEGLERAFELTEQLEELLVRPNPPLARVVALIDELHVVAKAVIAEQDTGARRPERDDR